MARLTEEERQALLHLAREALELGVRGQKLPPLDWSSLPPRLREPGATFVTLTRDGRLRGCVGALEATQPLAEDVREHAIAAALYDYRFPPVTPAELPDIRLEVSYLTPLKPLQYSHPEDLPQLLRPGVDGVVLSDGLHKATFLPQVWNQLPDPEDFLSQLCLKMGAAPDLWRRRPLQVWTYQVEKFHEPGYREEA